MYVCVCFHVSLGTTDGNTRMIVFSYAKRALAATEALHTCMHANAHKHTHTPTHTGVSDCASNPTMIKRLKEKAPLAFMLAFRDVRDFGSERFISLPFLSPSPLLFVHAAAPVAPASAGGPAAGYPSKQVGTDKRPSSESRDLSVEYPVHQVFFCASGVPRALFEMSLGLF